MLTLENKTHIRWPQSSNSELTGKRNITIECTVKHTRKVTAWYYNTNWCGLLNTTTSFSKHLGQDNLVLSTGLMWIDHCKEIWKLMFQALALCQSEWTNCKLCGLYTERWSCAIGWCIHVVMLKTTE